MSGYAGPTTTQVALWQRIIATIGSLVACAQLFALVHRDVEKIAIALVALVAAAVLVHLRSLGPQLVARAVWWANLGLGTAFCVFGGHSERRAGLVVAVACGVALLVIGRKGLAEATERAGYAPAAFRSSLTLLMALGLADAQTFGLFAMISLSESHSVFLGILLALVAICFTVGFVGLYRLRLWGALLNAATALVFGVAILTDVPHYDSGVRMIFGAVCAVQILAATPMMIGLVRGKPLPSPPPRLRGLGAIAAVVGVLLLAVWGAVLQ